MMINLSTLHKTGSLPIFRGYHASTTRLQVAAAAATSVNSNKKVYKGNDRRPPRIHDAGVRKPSTEIDPMARARIEELRETTTKRRVALVMGYDGSAYHGMQMTHGAGANPDLCTIEQQLWDALSKTSLLFPTNLYDPSKASLSFSSRTDKRVHAARMIVSLNLRIPKELEAEMVNKAESDAIAATGYTKDELLANGMTLPVPSAFRLPRGTDHRTMASPLRWDKLPSIAEELNSHLPEDIRVFSAIGVQNTFRARDLCFVRAYEYVMPAHLLLNSQPEDPPKSIEELRTMVDEMNNVMSDFLGTIRVHNFQREISLPFRPFAAEHHNAVTAEFMEENGDKIQQLIDSVDVNDDNAVYPWRPCPIPKKDFHRTVYRMRARLVTSVCDQPMIAIEIIGQSFMLHQIRLMMAATIMTMRGLLPRNFIRMAQDVPITFNLPLAPAEGLLLRDAAFQHTNNMDCIYTSHTRNVLRADQSKSFLEGKNQISADQFLATKIYPKIIENWQDSRVAEQFNEMLAHFIPNPEVLPMWEDLYNRRITELQSRADEKEAIALKQLASKMTQVHENVLQLMMGNAPARYPNRLRELAAKDLDSLLPKGLMTELCVRFNVIPDALSTEICRSIALRALIEGKELNVSSKVVIDSLIEEAISWGFNKVMKSKVLNGISEARSQQLLVNWLRTFDQEIVSPWMVNFLAEHATPLQRKSSPEEDKAASASTESMDFMDYISQMVNSKKWIAEEDLDQWK